MSKKLGSIASDATKSPNASASFLGYDFQINAAIVLMLENIKIAKSIKVEGQKEDIEISLINGNMIYSQAKSVEDPLDFSHVKRNLEESLRTLNNAAITTNIEKLIYITNSPNPLSNQKLMHLFYGFSVLPFNDLPPSAQKIIENIINKYSYTNIDKSRLEIHTFSFYGTDVNNRYKVIKEKINEFLSSIDIVNGAYGQKVLETWQRLFSFDASLRTKEVQKKEMMWPLIVLICDIDKGDPILDDCDEGELGEISQQYGIIIANNTERFEFITKVTTSYLGYGQNMTSRERQSSFIANCWAEFRDEFNIINVTPKILEIVVKLTISKIIKSRFMIDKIKKGANL